MAREPKPRHKGNPRRRALLERAGLWPVPDGMTAREAGRLARQKLGTLAGVNADRAKLARMLAEHRAAPTEAAAHELRRDILRLVFGR